MRHPALTVAAITALVTPLTPATAGEPVNRPGPPVCETSTHAHTLEWTPLQQPTRVTVRDSDCAADTLRVRTAKVTLGGCPRLAALVKSRTVRVTIRDAAGDTVDSRTVTGGCGDAGETVTFKYPTLPRLADGATAVVSYTVDRYALGKRTTTQQVTL